MVNKIEDIDLKLVPNLLGISNFILVTLKPQLHDAEFRKFSMGWKVYGPMQRMHDRHQYNSVTQFRMDTLTEELEEFDRRYNLSAFNN